ncbi:MAG: hypothetical protein NTX88_04690, partial [Candidatus Atribacteria bacterium]|nr:hypothetical protein [Candidatus Atribacteria bacterium]
ELRIMNEKMGGGIFLITETIPTYSLPYIIQKFLKVLPTPQLNTSTTQHFHRRGVGSCKW